MVFTGSCWSLMVRDGVHYGMLKANDMITWLVISHQNQPVIINQFQQTTLKNYQQRSTMANHAYQVQTTIA